MVISNSFIVLTQATVIYFDITMIKLLADIRKTDVSLAGGKGASLGEMISIGIPIPQGFVVTPDSFNELSKLDESIRQDILNSFDDLEMNRVAVRSSALAEDGSDASWAGQMETFLNVQKEDLIGMVEKCRESIESNRASAYAQGKDSKSSLSMAVVVQSMIDSEMSGVMFTANPVSMALDQIMIESCLGLGELLVGGEITPENIIVNKDSLRIIVSTPPNQKHMMVYDQGNKLIEVAQDKQTQPILDPKMIIKLAEMGKKIESHYGSPQDIEWAVYNNELYITQSRPITTLNLGDIS